MRTCVISSLVAAALLLGLDPQLGAGDKKDLIPVDLKSFQFKVKDDLAALFGYNENEEKLFFYTNGPAEATVKIPADGEYEIAIKASGDKAKDERAKFKVSLDGKPVGKETQLSDDEPKEYKLTATTKAGDRKLVIEFTNDEYKENEYDRNFYVHAVTLKRVK